MPKLHAGQPVIEHPNRNKAASKSSRAIVILLLLLSAVLITIVMIGGWSAMQGMSVVSIAWVLIYLGAAYVVSRWNRGVLPVLAALGIIMVIFAGLATGSWFNRNTIGYQETTISASLLGTLTAIIIPVQILLILASLQAFGQQWNVEIEHWPGEDDDAFAPSY